MDYGFVVGHHSDESDTAEENCTCAKQQSSLYDFAPLGVLHFVESEQKERVTVFYGKGDSRERTVVDLSK